jgi:hypothetical protein
LTPSVEHRRDRKSRPRIFRGKFLHRADIIDILQIRKFRGKALPVAHPYQTEMAVGMAAMNFGPAVAQEPAHAILIRAMRMGSDEQNVPVQRRIAGLGPCFAKGHVAQHLCRHAGNRQPVLIRRIPQQGGPAQFFRQDPADLWHDKSREKPSHHTLPQGGAGCGFEFLVVTIIDVDEDLPARPGGQIRQAIGLCIAESDHAMLGRQDLLENGTDVRFARIKFVYP